MSLNTRVVRSLALAAGLLLAVAACAQEGRFAFAAQAQARSILGQQDDYLRATGALERSVLLGVAGPVDRERLAAAMGETARDWTDDEKRAIAPMLARLDAFLSGMQWKGPPAILLVKASDALMDGLPHTRANAIVLPEGMLQQALARPAMLEFLLVHETFHVLTRADPAARDTLYGAIGFRACAAVEMPPALADLRITNPDAPESLHAIEVRWRGQPAEALPYVHFPSAAVDPRSGFAAQMRTSWLLVERQDGRCRVRDGSPAREELEGLYEQVGRNTGYLLHAEEILADNFALLFREHVAPGVTRIHSPEILERMRTILR